MVCGIPKLHYWAMLLLVLGSPACSEPEALDGGLEDGDGSLDVVVGRCDNYWDDDGLWALSMQRDTGCPWKCPPNYDYQVATPSTRYEEWAADLANEASIKLVLIGDEGQLDPNTAAVTAQAAHEACGAEGCDLGLLLGDNFYSHTVDSTASEDWARFREAFDVFCSPACDSTNTFHFWVSLGNHDYFPRSLDVNGRLLSGNVIQAQVSYTEAEANAGHLWMMPDRSFRIPGLPSWLGLWVMDTVVEVETLKWENEGKGEGVVHELRASLTAALEEDAASDAERWRIVAGHHPALTVGKRGRESRSTDKGFRCQSYLEVSTMRSVADELTEAGMQVFLTAHEHNQQLHAGDRYLEILSGSASKPSMGEILDAESAIFTHEEKPGFAILTFTPDALVVELYEVVEDAPQRPEAQRLSPVYTYSRGDIEGLRQVLGPLLE